MNIKYTRIIKKIYKTENILNGLTQLFGSQFKLDWIGRAYAVLNPNLDENGNYAPNKQIFEYNEVGLDNTKMVEQWVMERMVVISNFIQNNNLFEILTYSFKRLDNYDNYLFILEPITLADFLKWGKRFALLILGLIVVGVALLIIL